MSGSTTFSYAQAAKGKSAPAPATTAPSQAMSATNVQSRDNVAIASTSGAPAEASTTSNELGSSANTRQPSVQPDLNLDDSLDAELKPSSNEGGAHLPETNDSLTGTVQNGTREAAPPSQLQLGDVNGSSQDPRGSDSKKGKSNQNGEKPDDDGQDNAIETEDKEEDAPPRPELSEAPIPAVNIWKQRMGEQAAKTKAAPPSSTATAPVANASLPRKKIITNDDTQAPSIHTKYGGAKGQKKSLDSTRGNDDSGSRRGGPRGSRAFDKDDKQAMAPAANAASWPTPETAASAEPKGSAQSEKSDKDDKDDGPAKPRQKEKWVHVPFVPTAVFQTPLPSRGPRTNRPTGRPSGRDPATRSSQNSSSAGPSKRAQENGATPRSASETPQSSKRTSAEASSEREPRKAGPLTPEAAKSGSESSTAGNKSEVAHASQHGAISRGPEALSRNTDTGKTTERSKDNTHHHKDGNYTQNSNATNYRGSERARGAGRGRGHHSANGPHSQQASFSHGTSGYSFPGNAPSRQSSYPSNISYPQMTPGNQYSSPSSGTPGRGRPNSMSFSNRGASQRGGSHHNNRAPSMQSVSLPFDAAMYAAPPIPYTYIENGLTSLVLTQLEYYFSIDNLCKDWFLRKHMDTQGFVFLNFIAQFRRMRELTTDYELIRAVCEASKNIEIVVGDDGHDRVRRQGGWHSFVLPMESRDQSAQHDGPTTYFHHPRPPFHQYTPQMMHGAFPHQPPMFSPGGSEHSVPPLMNGLNMPPQSANGVNGHAIPGESQLSAAVPEFAPSSAAPTGKQSIANGSGPTMNGYVGHEHSTEKI